MTGSCQREEQRVTTGCPGTEIGFLARLLIEANQMIQIPLCL